MAYLNETDDIGCPTPQKSRSGRNSAFTMPTRRSQPGNAGSPVSRYGSDRSTPPSASNRRPRLRRTSVSSLKAAIGTLPGPTTFFRQDVSLLQKGRTVPRRSASHKQSPTPLPNVSQRIRSRSPRQRQSPPPRSSNHSQTFDARTESNLNATNYAHEEEVENQVESEVNEDEENEEEEVEEEVEEEGQDIYGLSEARATYLDRNLPPFVIGRPRDDLTRDVIFRPRDKNDNAMIDGKLIFKFWDEEQSHGLWTLTDDEGYKWIVKYFATGNGYRAWMGVHSGYDETCLAFPRKRKPALAVQNLVRQNTMVEDSGESEENSLDTGRIFRKRNVDQIHPYYADKTKYERSKDGKKHRNFKTVYIPDPALTAPKPSPKPQPCQQSNPSSKNPSVSRHSSDPSTATSTTAKPHLSTTSISPNPTTLSLERIQNNTTLYIFTNSDFAKAPGVIYLKSCPDIGTFFKLMPLVAGVPEQDIRFITVRFDWLTEESVRSGRVDTIRMVRGLEDSYEKMVEEVRGAPGWNEGGKVGVKVDVVLK